MEGERVLGLRVLLAHDEGLEPALESPHEEALAAQHLSE